MPEFPQHRFLHGVCSLCGSRYNNTLFLSRLQEGERGLYTFYAINNETEASINFSISVKCEYVALPLPKTCSPQAGAPPAQCPQETISAPGTQPKPGQSTGIPRVFWFHRECILPLLIALAVSLPSPTAPPRVCNVWVPANDSGNLHCTAAGYPAPRIEWYQCPTYSDR